jgi:uncharacterized protein YaaR (DUF327 family)
LRIRREDRTRVSSYPQHREKAVSSTQARTFIDFLESQEEPGVIDFQRALAQVDEYARRFKDSPIYYNLVKYKEVVRAVLRALIRNSMSVDEQSFLDHRGRRRLFVMVRTVDDKLEELTRLFLRNQLSGLELVSRLDEIRGMLLDLYL